jgi:hypothetical protein
MALADADPGDALEATAVVFSRDRALQLDACIRSMVRFAPYKGPVVVLYTTSTDEFERGYRELALPERVTLVRETTFEVDVHRTIGDAGDFLVFHTDDDVFFRSASVAPVLPQDAAAFSLRLGLNTTYCYPFARAQEVPETAASDAYIAWDWTRGTGDFSYPLSLDGHIFRTSMLTKLLSRARFMNPNTLEAALMRRRHLAPSLMVAYRESVLVSLPLNIVSTTQRNRAAEDPSLSPEALNERFLAGERLDLDAMDFSTIGAAHQVIEPVFR